MAQTHELQMDFPIYQNITVVQGDQFQILPLWMTVNRDTNEALPKDVAGYAAKMQVRSAPGTDVIAEFSTDNARILLPVEGQDQVEEWESSGIFVFADSTKKWNIWIMVPATDTDSFPPGVYQYDLKLVPPGNPGGEFSFYKGSFCIEAEVTR